MDKLKYQPQEGPDKPIEDTQFLFYGFRNFWTKHSDLLLQDAIRLFINKNATILDYKICYGKETINRPNETVEIKDSQYFPFMVRAVLEENNMLYYFSGDRFVRYNDLQQAVQSKIEKILEITPIRFNYAPEYLKTRNAFLDKLYRSTEADAISIEYAYKKNLDQLDRYEIDFKQFRDKVFEYLIFEGVSDNTQTSYSPPKKSHTKPINMPTKQNKEDSKLRTVLGLITIFLSIYIGFRESSILWGILCFIITNIIGAPIIYFVENRMQKNEYPLPNSNMDDEDDELELPYSYHTPMASKVKRK